MKIQKLNVPFAQVPNELLCDKNISLKAKGLWAYIQSKPNDYDFSSERIVEETKEEVRGIQNTLKELEEAGYLKRDRQQNGKVDYVLIFPICSFSREAISPSAQTADISKKDIQSNNSNKDIIITSVVEKSIVGEKPKIESREFFDGLQEKGQKFTDLVAFISDKYKVAPAYIAEELVSFCNYWTEKNQSGTKERWQLEKTFEAKRRLVTWFKNKRDWKNGRTQQPSKYQVENL